MREPKTMLSQILIVGFLMFFMRRERSTENRRPPTSASWSAGIPTAEAIDYIIIICLLDSLDIYGIEMDSFYNRWIQIINY